MRTKLSVVLIAALAGGAAALIPGLAAAEFPDKPITMLIGFRPGGAVDTTGRLLAAAMEKELGQPVVGVTKAGGGGTVMASTLMTAAPDGYTIGMGASAAYALTPQMNPKLKFKIGDFDHIATVSIPRMPSWCGPSIRRVRSQRCWRTPSRRTGRFRSRRRSRSPH